MTRAGLFLGALVFLFPFYYMVVGSFQKSPDTSVKGVFPTGGWTLHNYADINSRVDLVQSLLNSVIVTSGVLFGPCCSGCSRATPWPGCTSGAAARCSR